MKTFYAVLLITVLLFDSNAQNRESDSLWSIMSETNSDSVRVYTLNRLSKNYRLTKPDSSMLLAKEALQLARNSGLKHGEAISLQELGNTYLMNGNHPMALEAYMQMLKINESLNNSKGIGVGLANIALIYAEQGDYRQSLDYYFKSKEIFDTATTDVKLVINLLNIGDTYDRMNFLDSAMQFTQQGYELSLRQGNNEYIGMALNNLGNIHSKMEGHEKLAMEYYKLGQTYSGPIGDSYVLAETYLGIAKLFEKSGQHDSAVYYGKLALREAQSISSFAFIKTTSEFLVDFYEKNQNADSAYYYSKIAIAARDSVFSEEKVKQVQSLKFSEQLRQQELAEARSKVMKERKRNLQFLGIGIFFVSLCLFVVLMMRKKTKSRFVEWMALIGLLLLFEFIIILIHPHVGKVSHESPVVMLIIQGCIAAVLAPTHHYLVKVVRKNMGHKIISREEVIK